MLNGPMLPAGCHSPPALAEIIGMPTQSRPIIASPPTLQQATRTSTGRVRALCPDPRGDRGACFQLESALLCRQLPLEQYI